MSGMGRDGVRLTTPQLLDRVHAEGVFLIVRSPAEQLRGAQWAAELEARAQSRGMHLAVRDMGHVALVFELNRPGISCDAVDGSGAGGDPMSPARLESWNRHPSHRPRLRLIPGGLNPDAAKRGVIDTGAPADRRRRRPATKGPS
jgi:hypothetical protein